MPASARHLPLLLMLLLACDPGDERVADAADGEAGEHADATEPDEPIELLDASAWVETPAELDPLAEHRPAEVVCPSAARSLEFGLLEVDTGACNYLSLSQPLAHAIAPGDRLRVTVWWQTLAAEEAATGHLALAGEAGLLWQLDVEIPGPADLRELEFESPIALAAGETLTFHLHNHGYNSWTLGGLEWLGHG